MTAPSSDRAYSVRRLDIDLEQDTVLDLWCASYPELERSSASRKLYGQYCANPAGHGCCVVVEHCDKPVGVQCLVPRRFVHGRSTYTAAILADYVVEPTHRSLGPALTLCRSVIDVAAAEFDFYYGFPNSKSSVILRRIGMPQRAYFNRFVRPLRSDRFLARKLSGNGLLSRSLIFAANLLLNAENVLRYAQRGRRWFWTEQQDFDAFFDECWTVARKPDALMGERNRKALSWRYPSVESRRISVAIDRYTGQRTGYVVWRLNGGDIDVLDVFCRDLKGQLAGLLSGFTREVSGSGAETLVFDFAGPPELLASVVSSGYRRRESRAVYVNVATRSAVSTASLDSLYLTNFDLDSN